jgi:hypothetical protein
MLIRFPPYRDELPLFTRLPRGGLLGNVASGGSVRGNAEMVGAYERGETLIAAPAGPSSSETYRTLEATLRVQEGLVFVVLQKGLA